MKKERKFSFGGVDVKFDISLDSLVEKITEGHRQKVEFLRKLIRKRDQYIHSLHGILKDKESAMYIMLDGYKIFKKASALYGLTDKQFMLLTYTYVGNICSYDRLKKYCISIGYPRPNRNDFARLIQGGYVVAVTKNHWAITDHGRNIVNNVYNAFRQDYYFFSGYKERIRNIKPEKIRKKRVFTPEQLEERSQAYKRMMAPYWNRKLKMMPKDRIVRCKIMVEWLEQNAESNPDADGFYSKLLEKWAAKEGYVLADLIK